MPLPTGYNSGMKVTTTRGKQFSLSALHHQTWTNASTIVTNKYVTSVAMRNSAGTSNFTLTATTTATYARNVVITVTHSSSIVACNGTITGTDMYGKTITEAWAITATGTSKTYTGKKAFKTITSISQTTAADASTNTFVAGDGKVLGCEMVNKCTVAVHEHEDGAVPTAGVMVAGVAGSATADEFGTYTPNSALNGALDFDVWYIVDNPYYDVTG